MGDRGIMGKKKVRRVKFFVNRWKELSIDGEPNKTWLRADLSNNARAFCTVCKSESSPNGTSFAVSEGYTAVTKHAARGKHNEALKARNAHPRQGQQYCLTWNGHDENLSKLFSKLRRDEHFCDVTIACEDVQFQAHKLVLAACSSLFNGILKKHSHPYPFIYLGGIKACDMNLLLDFMYSGTVTVEEGNLQSLIEAAETCLIRGLMKRQSLEKKKKASPQPQPSNVGSRHDRTNPTASNDLTTSSIVEHFPLCPAPKHPYDEFCQESVNSNDVPAVVAPLIVDTAVKVEDNLTFVEEPHSIAPDPTSPNSGHMTNNNEITEQQIEVGVQQLKNEVDYEAVKEWKDLKKFVIISKRANILTGERRTYRCTICGHSDVSSSCQVQFHVERAHFQGKLNNSCSICAKQFPTRESLQRHTRLEHISSKKRKQYSFPSEISEIDPNDVKDWEDLKNFIVCKDKGKKGPGGKLTILECTICGHKEWRTGHLMNHLEQKHFRKRFVYSCKICGAKPSTKHAFDCHMREKHRQ